MQSNQITAGYGGKGGDQRGGGVVEVGEEKRKAEE